MIGRASRTGERELNKNFKSSRYFKNWQKLITSDELRKLNKEHGFDIVFYPHANMQKSLSLFEIPDYVKPGEIDKQSIQSIFIDSQLMITDFSSVAFEMAALRKPVLYFQFDKDLIFGNHVYSEGYYDYEQDGFGPVFYEIDKLLKQLGTLVQDIDKITQTITKPRAEKHLPLFDGNCCERVYEAITRDKA